jgi:small-conductance mechanosensitive channel
MARLAGIDIDAPPEVVLPIFVVVLLVASLLAARVARFIAVRLLSRGTQGSTAPPRLGVPVGVAVLVGGVLLAVPELPLPGQTGRWVTDTLVIVFVLACGITLSRAAVAGLTEYAARHPSVTPAMGVARVAVRLAIGILTFITALEALGVPVAPLLTTLGVGSLAVALALQETLANFFAGLYLLADRPVRSGDYIKIHDGEEGYVESIGWRSSRLRTQKNNVVIVPNQKLSQAILTNYHLPSAPVTMIVAVAIDRNADPTAVERALVDELTRAVAEVPELQGATPFVRLGDITDAGQVWNCIANVKDIGVMGLAGHQVRMRLLARLRRETIPLGVPERVLVTSDDRAPVGIGG